MVILMEIAVFDGVTPRSLVLNCNVSQYSVFLAGDKVCCCSLIETYSFQVIPPERDQLTIGRGVEGVGGGYAEISFANLLEVPEETYEHVALFDVLSEIRTCYFAHTSLLVQ
jgi:hypothetical protein